MKPRATASSEIRSCAPPDYNSYKLSTRELIGTVAVASLKILLAAVLCYDGLWAVPFLLVYVPYALREASLRRLEARKWALNLQFSDAIRAISTAVEAGYSVENAITEAYHDLSLTYSADEMIMRELALISARIRNNQPVEEAFGQFAARTGLEDIANFADVFATAKRTGGNVIAIIRSTSGVIRARIELARELKTAIAAKKYESDIMKAVPCVILIYLRVFSPGMLEPLYGNAGGIIFMTAALVLYLVLCKLSDRLVEVKI